MNRKVVLIIFWILFLTNCVYPQDWKCQELINNCIKDFGLIQRPTNDTYFLDVSLENQIRENSKIISQKDRVQMYLNSKYIRYQSKHVDIYGDDKETVSLIKSQKVIIISKSISNELQAKNFKTFSFLQDTIINMCHIDNCQSLKNRDGKMVIVTELVMPSDLSKDLQVDKIKYEFSFDNGQLLRSEIIGTNSAQLVRSITIFNRIDLDHKKTNISVPALSLFFSKQGKLHDKYVGYKVIDNR